MFWKYSINIFPICIIYVFIFKIWLSPCLHLAADDWWDVRVRKHEGVHTDVAGMSTALAFLRSLSWRGRQLSLVCSISLRSVLNCNSEVCTWRGLQVMTGGLQKHSHEVVSRIFQQHFEQQVICMYWSVLKLLLLFDVQYSTMIYCKSVLQCDVPSRC